MTAVIALIAGCGAGQVAQTAVQQTPEEGANGNRDSVFLRNVYVATPALGSYESGTDAPMYGAIVTGDATSDTLLRVTTDAAQDVELVRGSTSDASGTPSGTASASGTASGSPSASASTSASSSAAASASPSAGGSASAAASPSASASAGPRELNLDLAPGSLLLLSEGRDYLLLRGLTRRLTPGMTINVTFSFAEVGDIQLKVPISTPNTPVPRPSPKQQANPE
jgi:copper(I)-binding protein